VHAKDLRTIQRLHAERARGSGMVGFEADDLLRKEA
jgi:hypothetical protein